VRAENFATMDPDTHRHIGEMAEGSTGDTTMDTAHRLAFVRMLLALFDGTDTTPN
jgi:hypothetical protein